MKDKILFWIDAGLAHFGIAKFVQEKYDCDLFAIIDINKGKKFFQEQQLVKFQKVWYYRDHVSKIDKNPDLKYLADFEKKYRINLWNIAYSDITFNHHNEYYRFNSDEILSIFEQECKFFENVLDEVKPDFLIIRMTDFSQNQLLHQICKARGVRILTLGHTRFGYRGMITVDTDLMDDFEMEENHIEHENKTIKELREFMKGYSEQQNAFRNEFRTSALQKLKAALRFLVLVSTTAYTNYYAHFGRTIFRVIINEISISLKKRYREFFINKNLIRHIDNEPFVYFPLQFQPERSTLILSPFYTNQLEVIINIAKALPIEHVLYVKEHPMQIKWGWRDTSYYKAILELPNVKLIHPSVSNDELVSKSSLVITVTGTSGLEAAFYQKPSIVFADITYSSLPSVHRLKSLEELPQAIRASLQKEVNLSDLNKFVNRIIKNSFEFDTSRFYRLVNDRFYYSGFLRDVDIPISKMISFLEDNGSMFDHLASEHIKKIEKYKKLDQKNKQKITRTIDKSETYDAHEMHNL